MMSKRQCCTLSTLFEFNPEEGDMWVMLVGEDGCVVPDSASSFSAWVVDFFGLDPWSRIDAFDGIFGVRGNSLISVQGLDPFADCPNACEVSLNNKAIMAWHLRAVRDLLDVSKHLARLVKVNRYSNGFVIVTDFI